MAFSCTCTRCVCNIFVQYHSHSTGFRVCTGANAYTWTAFFFPAWLDQLQISAKSFWVFSVEQRYEKQCDNVMQWRGAGERVSG